MEKIKKGCIIIKRSKMQNRISYWEFIITDFNMRIHLEWQCISQGVVWLWNFIPLRIDVNHSSSATIKVDTIAMVLYQPILLLFLLIQNCNHLLASYFYLCAVCWLVHNFCLHCIFFWAMQDIVKLLAWSLTATFVNFRFSWKLIEF